MLHNKKAKRWSSHGRKNWTGFHRTVVCPWSTQWSTPANSISTTSYLVWPCIAFELIPTTQFSWTVSSCFPFHLHAATNGHTKTPNESDNTKTHSELRVRGAYLLWALQEEYKLEVSLVSHSSLPALQVVLITREAIDHKLLHSTGRHCLQQWAHRLEHHKYCYNVRTVPVGRRPTSLFSLLPTYSLDRFLL